jgi:toxin-antitoxin system PIN domain toxin
LKLLDVNIVLAAHRDDHPDFELTRAWLDHTLAERTPFAVVDLVAGSFLRIATNRRIFAIPTPIDEAFAYLKALRAQAAHVMLAPGPAHLTLLERLCATGEASGDLVADAQLAAIALEHACELVSFDRDFSRFSELRWTRPSLEQRPDPPA